MFYMIVVVKKGAIGKSGRWVVVVSDSISVFLFCACYLKSGRA